MHYDKGLLNQQVGTQPIWGMGDVYAYKNGNNTDYSNIGHSYSPPVNDTEYNPYLENPGLPTQYGDMPPDDKLFFDQLDKDIVNQYPDGIPQSIMAPNAPTAIELEQWEQIKELIKTADPETMERIRPKMEELYKKFGTL